MKPPGYFEEIRLHAQRRWDQLEADRELAGPWHQLFKQVQSPRHVLSELLQNADDAGAKKAEVRIDDEEFVFVHDGGDFEEENFASLCRFGYSNKRALHTIGFRGIGFKSTFSLGQEVSLSTPTLSVVFRKARFTEPHWKNSPAAKSSNTTVRVAFQDQSRRKEIESNLQTWRENPASLLFFRSLRHLTLGDEEVGWRHHSSGPTPNAEWFTLAHADETPVLFVRSELADFPEDCIAEIREERMLHDEEDAVFPPCKVEIVLGLEGRLFVVLPTGVSTSLPFACNAPFIQDPARVTIKDPEISPTNRWLLERVGRLAGETMVAWLNRSDMPLDERAKAYRLIPSISWGRDSIEATCRKIVSDEFFAAIETCPILLTVDGTLVESDQCVAAPNWLLDVWGHQQLSEFFDPEHRPLFCTCVDSSARAELINHEYLSEWDDKHILAVLRDNHLPRPKTWKNLLNLWSAVQPHVTKYTSPSAPHFKGIRIVPVQSQEQLYSADEIVRLGDKKLLRSEADWEFLSTMLLVMNPSWPRFLAEQRRTAVQDSDTRTFLQVEAADKTLQALKLSAASDATVVMQRVATAFFAREDISIEDCIRLAHISATLGAQASENFQFVTVSGVRMSSSQTKPLIADTQFDLDSFVDQEWYKQHVLHSDYWSSFDSCTSEEWEQWLKSGRSGLLPFIPLEEQISQTWKKARLHEFLKQRGHDGEVRLPFVTSEFIFCDWDFSPRHWTHWNSLARSDQYFWHKLLKRILTLPRKFWESALSATVSQVATTKRSQTLDTDSLVPAWILKIRGLECLRDTWGKLRKPADVFRRTAETEALLDVEPFIPAELDTEATRPLLIRLGVQDSPAGPDRLLERLIALSGISNPPLIEVQKWCRRLDSILPECSTEEVQELRIAFQSQKLILTSAGTWAKRDEVFLIADDQDVPGASVIHDSIRELVIWQKMGVAERPTLDLIIDWLQKLPRNQKLEPDVLRRVRAVLSRHARRIWIDCGCWLNLEGEWTDVREFRYSVSMRTLVAWRHLFPAVKKQIADFQALSGEALEAAPFSELKSLASCLQERVQGNLAAVERPVAKPWLAALGAGLSRIVVDSKEVEARIRTHAARLSETSWRTTAVLETVPYLDGVPAGTARSNDVLWDGKTLFVIDRPVTRLMRQIAAEISRPFDDRDIEDAIKLCIERPAEHVTEYLHQNFVLAESREAGVSAADVEVQELTAADDNAEATSPAMKNPVHQQTDRLSAEENNPQASAEYEHLASEHDSDDSKGVNSEERPSSTRPVNLRSKLQSLADRFAQSEGFTREANGERYLHSDGRWIQKKTGMPFPWEMYSADGHLVKCMLVREHCLVREPLQIASEIWDACRTAPGSHSLIIATVDGKPQELTGTRLLGMVNEGRLVLYPATYRVVYPIDEGRTSGP